LYLEKFGFLCRNFKVLLVDRGRFMYIVHQAFPSVGPVYWYTHEEYRTRSSDQELK
jgi:hypothetical protein